MSIQFMKIKFIFALNSNHREMKEENKKKKKRKRKKKKKLGKKDEVTTPIVRNMCDVLCMSGG